MSLQDRLAKPPAKKTRWEIVVAGMPDGERAALEAACLNSDWSNAEIIRHLAAEGYSVSKDTFGPYRRRVCLESR